LVQYDGKEILNLYSVPMYRGLGIATALLTIAEEEMFFVMHSTSVRLHDQAHYGDGTSAAGFYPGMGYTTANPDRHGFVYQEKNLNNENAITMCNKVKSKFAEAASV
jgi:hypothetical protein